MTNIKFRGKRIDNGEWAFGYYVGAINKHIIIDEKGVPYIVDPKTVGQYTGLDDKNKVEIYEGNICQYKTGEKKSGVYAEETIFKGFVRFDDGQFEIGNHNGYGGEWESLSYLLGRYHKIAHDFEVIGNKIDNPELIKP